MTGYAFSGTGRGAELPFGALLGGGLCWAKERLFGEIYRENGVAWEKVTCTEKGECQ